VCGVCVVYVWCILVYVWCMRVTARVILTSSMRVVCVVCVVYVCCVRGVFNVCVWCVCGVCVVYSGVCVVYACDSPSHIHK